METTAPATALPLSERAACRAVTALTGAALGLLLPVIAALLYRTYSIAVAPVGLELSRQLGLPFVAAEIALIVCAWRAGFDPLRIVRDLDRADRAMLIVFAATFWIGSAFASEEPVFSSMFSFIWVVHLIFGASVYHCVRRGGATDAGTVAAWFAAGLGVLTVVTAIHFATPPAGLAIPAGAKGWGAAVPGFISHRLFGAWTAAVAALLLGVAWQRAHDDRASPWLYPAIALAVGLSVWTGTRAALLGAGVALVAGAVLSGRPASRDFWVKAPLTIALASMVAIGLVPDGDETFMLYRSAESQVVGGFTSGRTDFWIASLQVAARSPLFGTGVGSSWWLVPLYGGFHVQPHNALVQFLLNWGVIATIAAMWLLGRATWRVHVKARSCSAIVPLVMMLDCLLAISMVDGTLHFSRFVMLIVALLGTCLAWRHEDTTAV